MSGKAPPRGPRALLGSLPASSSGVPSSATTAQPQPAPQSHPQRPPATLAASPTKKIGTAPPTGPRSLTNGIIGRQPHSGPKHLSNGHTSNAAAGPSVVAGLGPNTLQNRNSIKGKKPEGEAGRSSTGGWQSSHTQANGWHDASSNGSSSSGIVASGSGIGSRAAISIPIASTSAARAAALGRDKQVIQIPFQPRSLARSMPNTEPSLPPPPPTYDPPPPPPPSQPPPPAPPPPPTQSPPSPPRSLPPSEPPPPPDPRKIPPRHTTRSPPLSVADVTDQVVIQPTSSSPDPSELNGTIPDPPPPSTSPPPEPTIAPPPPPPPIHTPPAQPPPPLPPSISLPPEPATAHFQPPPPPSSPPPPPPPPPNGETITHPPPPLDPRVPLSAPPSSQPTIQNVPSASSSQLPSTPRIPSPQPAPQPEEPKLFSLPPLPPYPPLRNMFPPGRSYKVLYDPAIEVSTSSMSSSSLKPQSASYFRSLIEHVRKNAKSAAVVQERIKGKAKGKEMLIRFDGDVVGAVEGEENGMKEEEIVVCDPRKQKGFKKLQTLRPFRGEFYEVNYEYDVDSTGPPPPTSVLITNIPPLTPNQQIRRHFGSHGTIMGYEPQIDKENGSALGIVFIRFATHEEAKRCAEKENGRKSGFLGVNIGMGKAGEGDEIRVVLDGEGLRLKAVMRELEERKKWEKEEKKRKALANGNGVASGSGGGSGGKLTPNVQTPVVQTPDQRRPQNQPQHGSSLLIPPQARASGSALNARPLHPSLPRNPTVAAASHLSQLPSSQDQPPNTNGDAIASPAHHTNVGPTPGHGLPATPVPAAQLPRVRRPPPNLVKARIAARAPPMSSRYPPEQRSTSSSSTPIHSSQGRTHHSRDDYRASPMAMSRSPSPAPLLRTALGSKGTSTHDLEKMHKEVVAELAKNKKDHVKIEGGAQMRETVMENEVRALFKGFKVEKVLKDHLGVYVTFETGDSARRAGMVLNSGTRMLAYQTVTFSVHPPPTIVVDPTKVWKHDELADAAQQLIVQELKELLEKDIVDRVVAPQLRKMITEEKSRIANAIVTEQKPAEKRGLKGLSFKKQKKSVVEEVKTVVVEETVETQVSEEKEDEEIEDEEVLVERPKKKRKKMVVKKMKKVLEEDVESEDEGPQDVAEFAKVEEVARKRAVSESREEKEPPRKKRKVEDEVESKQKKTTKKKSTKTAMVEEAVDDVVLPDDLDFDVPAVAQVRFASSSGFESSLSPSRSSSVVQEPKRPPRVVTPPPTPPPDPLAELCADDEDLYFAKLAISGIRPPTPEPRPEHPVGFMPPSTDALPFRKHITGSARTEGFYKITHAEKAAYVAQYQARATNVEAATPVDEPQIQHITSSRSNRANARRRAQGLEEINQVQRAVALSKGETAANELSFKFNQLQTRKKHLRFARSPIHDWGLYAMEKISRGEMVIEYVGEVIRAQVADKREKTYERQGIGSSYLFRIDEDLVVDATKKGNLGRLINHSCDPNCTAKIITINGEKKIVIYAKQDIELGDEITYDYHFPFEQDKIPCLCGSAKCRGYLN